MRGFPMSKRENKTCSYLLLVNGMVPFQMVDLPTLLHDYGFNIMAQRMIGSLSQWKDDLLSCPGHKKLFCLTDTAVLLLIGNDIVKEKLRRERETTRPSFPENRHRPMLLLKRLNWRRRRRGVCGRPVSDEKPFSAFETRTRISISGLETRMKIKIRTILARILKKAIFCLFLNWYFEAIDEVASVHCSYILNSVRFRTDSNSVRKTNLNKFNKIFQTELDSVRKQKTIFKPRKKFRTKSNSVRKKSSNILERKKL